MKIDLGSNSHSDPDQSHNLVQKIHEHASIGDSPLPQGSAIANGRYCHVMHKLLYPSVRVRTAPPVSVRVRVRVSVCYSLRILFCMCGSLR